MCVSTLYDLVDLFRLLRGRCVRVWIFFNNSFQTGITVIDNVSHHYAKGDNAKGRHSVL